MAARGVAERSDDFGVDRLAFLGGGGSVTLARLQNLALVEQLAEMVVRGQVNLGAIVVGKELGDDRAITRKVWRVWFLRLNAPPEVRH